MADRKIVWKMSIGLLSLVFLLVFNIECEHAEPVKPEQLQPTIESIQTNIFNQSCAVSGCHSAADRASGLNLSEGSAFSNLVGVPSLEKPELDRVEPGKPDSSYLVWKIEGRSDIQGDRMPRGRPPLSQEQINVIRQWIADGALPATNAPVVSNIPDQSINQGESFDSFDLDNFVTDADHPDSLLTWSVNGDSVLSVSIDTGRTVTISITDTTFTGNETITFTATDPDGLSDSDTARYTVNPPQVTFTQIQQTVFTPSCAFTGCHGGSNPAEDMNLEAGQAYSNIVNVPSQQQPSLDRIEPSQPMQSYLYLKVVGDTTMISGQQMPFGGPPLSQETIDKIRQWIESGALNN